MAKSRAEIQKKSDEKRGVTIKAFNISKQTAEDIAFISKQTGKKHNQLLTEWVARAKKEL